MNRLKQKYQDQVTKAYMKKYGVKNAMAVPKVTKVTINMGITDQSQNPRARMQIIDNVLEQFQVICGQKANITTARISIAGFKLRENDPIGVMVTLRGEKMWQFLDKLISLALPRVKDFQGVKKTAFDGHGNYSLGLKEQISFPEIDYDKIESIRSLQININTNSKSDEKTLFLLTELGMPFVKEDK